MEDYLKPCPFCGGEAEYVKYHLYGSVTGHTVWCEKCGCEIKSYSSKQNAYNAWNRRKGDS